VLLSIALGASSRAAELTTEERERALAAVRHGIVGFTHLRGGCSGVLVDAEEGLVVTARSRIHRGGALKAFAFESVTFDDGRRNVQRRELGEAKLLALHGTLDLAVVSVKVGEFQRPPRHAASAAAAKGKRYVVSLPSAVTPAEALDLDVRLLDEGESVSRAVYLTGAGGAVLDRELSLTGMATYDVATMSGVEIPLAEVVAAIKHADNVDAEAVATFLADTPDLPDCLRASPSPGGPAGKRVSFGQDVFAIKESRAVVCNGQFVLDRHDPLEYVACPIENGKLHESVVGLTADPAVINLAMIALKYKSGGGVERLGDKAVPFGDPVEIYVEWDFNEARAIASWLASIDPPWKRPNHAGVVEKKKEGVITWKPGTVVRMRLEDLAFDQVQNRPMPPVKWVFTGSAFGRDEDTGRRFYRATVDGVLVAVYRDPVAVFNSPLETGSDDMSYHVNDALVPPRGTACQLIITPASK
jgi:hypothetical protein